MIDEGADIGRQRINDAIRILNSDMISFLRTQLESIGANAQLIERVTILEESKAIALTLDLTEAGPDFLKAFNLDVEGGLVRAWEGLINTGLETDVTWLTRASKWLDEGVEIVEGTGTTAIIRKNGEELGKIVDGELQPSNFLTGGTKIDDAGSGYDFYKLANGEIGFRSRFVITVEDEFGIVFVKLENGTQVGRGSLNSDNLLELEIDIIPDGVKLAKGESVFNQILVNQTGIVKGIKAEWGVFLPDNLNTFNNLILTEVNPGNMTLQQAAFETFTGKMATNKGFVNIGPNDIIGTPNSDGTYNFVTVIFR